MIIWSVKENLKQICHNVELVDKARTEKLANIF